MLVLYSYPELFGVPDNNPYGLKVDTFLRLTQIPYKLKHVVDTKSAPRGQLPYIVDEGQTVTDSNTIIEFLCQKYDIDIDNDLTTEQKNLHFLITRMLDHHLYWVMSYSRWQDERFWPLFKAEFLQKFPSFSKEALENGRHYNIEKYYYQGIGRYSQDQIYHAGIQNLTVLNSILGNNRFLFGDNIHSIDACCYGFLANILYFEINTPLKEFILTQRSLKQYIDRIRQLLDY
ncbi:glutathione S-transferase family protein [Legionella hackeliae]|uniref:GST N-terminal domain-containing protein n=1 Tax=Legionella hackeliae TaxID=449 RepID=A0A0A8US87_LEGHA|nr:glutathione S-transferase family protein [Legionella hackeliae]KTD09973.1 hypothetical protein Lhac_2341 [Legionella hackeliae]CEK11725.1 conserved protein of unknown function [Legionella hackeliae]STX48495.1 Uncharacterised protein [Legionella hackeliae]